MERLILLSNQLKEIRDFPFNKMLNLVLLHKLCNLNKQFHRDNLVPKKFNKMLNPQLFKRKLQRLFKIWFKNFSKRNLQPQLEKIPFKKS
jgi:hypothetical protein